MRLVIGAIAVTTLAVVPGWSQPRPAEPPSDWVIRRVEADGLQLGLTLTGVTGELRELGRLGRWSALPASRAEAVQVAVASTAESGLRLSAGEWEARLVPQADGTALFLVAGDAEPGLAYPTTELGAALRGDWTRVQVHPSGPRRRQLRVSRAAVVLYDRLDRPTAVDARQALAEGGGPALVLEPAERGPVLVRLEPFQSGFVALEAGDDTFEVVHASGAVLVWLDVEPGAVAGGGEAPVGRWVLGPGDGTDLRMEFDLDEPAGWSRLGPDDAGALTIEWAEPVLTLTTDAGEVYHAVELDADWAVAWHDDDHYSTLRRRGPIGETLLGEWRVERAASFVAEPVRVESDAVIYTRWERRIPASEVGGPETAQRLALTPDDRSGRLLRLRSLGSQAFVSDAGDIWYRPGQRDSLAERLPRGDCADWAEAARIHLRTCLEQVCAAHPDDQRACSLAEDVIVPLRCTRQQRQRAERLLNRDCDAIWPGDLSPSP